MKNINFYFLTQLYLMFTGSDACLFINSTLSLISSWDMDLLGGQLSYFYYTESILKTQCRALSGRNFMR